MDDKPSPLSSFVTAATCNQTMKLKLEIISEQIISQISRARDKSSGLGP